MIIEAYHMQRMSENVFTLITSEQPPIANRYTHKHWSEYDRVTTFRNDVPTHLPLSFDDYIRNKTIMDILDKDLFHKQTLEQLRKRGVKHATDSLNRFVFAMYTNDNPPTLNRETMERSFGWQLDGQDNNIIALCLVGGYYLKIDDIRYLYVTTTYGGKTRMEHIMWTYYMDRLIPRKTDPKKREIGLLKPAQFFDALVDNRSNIDALEYLKFSIVMCETYVECCTNAEFIERGSDGYKSR
jgi:hypothetical protein